MYLFYTQFNSNLYYSFIVCVLNSQIQWIAPKIFKKSLFGLLGMQIPLSSHTANTHTEHTDYTLYLLTVHIISHLAIDTHRDTHRDTRKHTHLSEVPTSHVTVMSGQICLAESAF